MNRKRYVILFFLCLRLLFVDAQNNGVSVNIWQGTGIRKAVPLTPYLAEGDNNVAVIVCPGGSYFWHDMEAEGRTVGNGINPNRIGVMGFSAGGHLVMSAAEQLSAAERPAFVVPVYPVVTMVDKCVHKRSRRALLGDSRKNNQQLREKLSLERHVPQDCPPVFLVNCKDDPIVKYRNSELLDSALTSRKIPHRYIQYKTGGHGFGATEHKGTAECRQWKTEFLKWLTALNVNNSDHNDP